MIQLAFLRSKSIYPFRVSEMFIVIICIKTDSQDTFFWNFFLNCIENHIDGLLSWLLLNVQLSSVTPTHSVGKQLWNFILHSWNATPIRYSLLPFLCAVGFWVHRKQAFKLLCSHLYLQDLNLGGHQGPEIWGKGISPLP